MAGGMPISWYNWAKMIFESAGLTPELKPTTERSIARLLGVQSFPPFLTASWTALELKACRRLSSHCRNIGDCAQGISSA